MTTTYKGRLQDLDDEFIKQLKQQYEDAEVEISLNVSASDISDLDEGDFWYIISLLNWDAGENAELILEPAIAYLSNQSSDAIFRFEDILAEKLFSLDKQKFAAQLGAHAYQPDKPFSADHFLYARCCVVANGKDFFLQVLQKPALIPQEFTFEPILAIARKAYQRKTGNKDFDYLPKVSYETFSNPEGWQETLTEKLQGKNEGTR